MPVACRSKNLWIVHSTKFLLNWRGAQLWKFRIVPGSVGFWYHLQENFRSSTKTAISRKVNSFFSSFFSIVNPNFHANCFLVGANCWCRLLLCKICHLHRFQMAFVFQFGYQLVSFHNQSISKQHPTFYRIASYL